MIAGTMFARDKADDAHARCFAGQNAVCAVLYDDTILWPDTHRGCRMQEQVWSGFAVLDHV